MTTSEVIFSLLGGAILALVAYIFITFRSDTADRLRHQDKLLETAIENNTKLTEIVQRHDVELKIIKDKVKLKI